MNRQEFSKLEAIIKGSYGRGLTVEQVRYWRETLDQLDGILILRLVREYCESGTPYKPALGQILDAYYRDKAGRTAKEHPDDGLLLKGHLSRLMANRGNWFPKTQDERDGCEYFRKLLELSHGLNPIPAGSDRKTKETVLDSRAHRAFNRFGGMQAMKAVDSEIVFIARKTFVELYVAEKP